MGSGTDREWGKGLWDSLAGAISTAVLWSEPPQRFGRRSQSTQKQRAHTEWKQLDLNSGSQQFWRSTNGDACQCPSPCGDLAVGPSFRSSQQLTFLGLKTCVASPCHCLVLPFFKTLELTVSFHPLLPRSSVFLSSKWAKMYSFLTPAKKTQDGQPGRNPSSHELPEWCAVFGSQNVLSKHLWKPGFSSTYTKLHFYHLKIGLFFLDLFCTLESIWRSTNSLKMYFWNQTQFFCCVVVVAYSCYSAQAGLQLAVILLPQQHVPPQAAQMSIPPLVSVSSLTFFSSSNDYFLKTWL